MTTDNPNDAGVQDDSTVEKNQSSMTPEDAEELREWRALKEAGFAETPQQHAEMLKGLRRDVNAKATRINELEASDLYNPNPKPARVEEEGDEGQQQEQFTDNTESNRLGKDMFSVIWQNFEANSDFVKHQDSILPMLKTSRFQKMIKSDGLVTAITTALNSCLTAEYNTVRRDQADKDALGKNRDASRRLPPGSKSTERLRSDPHDEFQRGVQRLETDNKSLTRQEFIAKHKKSYRDMVTELAVKRDEKLASG